MSSFKKSGSTSERRLPGTIHKHGLTCVSSGIPSLDHIIGGSIPVGSIFVIEEDVLRNYCRVMLKYFLAEAVVTDQAVLFASLDDNYDEIISELPTPTDNSHDEAKESNNDEMKIAWRYEPQNVVDSSFGSHSNFGRNFDLSRHLDKKTIEDSDITCWKPNTAQTKSSEFHNHIYFDLLSTINNTLKKQEYRTSTEGTKKVLRICIASLGSPIWMAHECEVGYKFSEIGRDIRKFIYCLRIMLKGTTAVALVTVPSHLFEEETTINRIVSCAESAIKLESFAGSARETNPVFREYHGLVHTTKLGAAPRLPPGTDLAFKLRRKKFLIEKLHLPPELEESSEREQDDITATPGCSSFHKKNIDF